MLHEMKYFMIVLNGTDISAKFVFSRTKSGRVSIQLDEKNLLTN